MVNFECKMLGLVRLILLLGLGIMSTVLHAQAILSLSAFQFMAAIMIFYFQIFSLWQP